MLCGKAAHNSTITHTLNKKRNTISSITLLADTAICRREASLYIIIQPNNIMRTGSSDSGKRRETQQGCWLGMFATRKNLFCEVNISGQKPNLASLAKEKPSGGVWFGTFCRQSTKRHGDDSTKKGQKKSNMFCDGGVWFRTEKKLTSFLLVAQVDVVKAPKKEYAKLTEEDSAAGKTNAEKNNSKKISTKQSKPIPSSVSYSSRRALKSIGNESGSGESCYSVFASRLIVAKPLPNSIRKQSRRKTAPVCTTNENTVGDFPKRIKNKL